jgi:hypothetical protein
LIIDSFVIQTEELPAHYFRDDSILVMRNEARRPGSLWFVRRQKNGLKIYYYVLSWQTNMSPRHANAAAVNITHVARMYQHITSRGIQHHLRPDDHICLDSIWKDMQRDFPLPTTGLFSDKSIVTKIVAFLKRLNCGDKETQQLCTMMERISIHS